MNKMILIAAVSFSLSAPAVLAVEGQHPDQKDAGMPMERMQDNMLKMHEQMHEIMQAKDPKERERLRQEHLKMMQQHMKKMGEGMGGMKCPGMMGGDGNGGTMDAPARK